MTSQYSPCRETKEFCGRRAEADATERGSGGHCGWGRGGSQLSSFSVTSPSVDLERLTYVAAVSVEK